MRRYSAVVALWILQTLVSAVVADQRVGVDWSQYQSTEGRPVSSAKAFTVVCFVGSECPLARLYGPRLSALASKFESNGVSFVGVDSNPQDSVDDIHHYIADHGITFPIIKDGDQQLVRLFRATRTPEVFVLDAEKNVRYRGRIDNQYQPGTSRGEATRHELRDAIEALIAGKPVPQSRTDAVGCLITILKSPRNVDPSAPAVTFTRNVAPILNQHCVECHREGEIGPFALTDYDEVIGWGEMMLEVIGDRRMPPWHADPSYGKFVGARHFPEKSLETIRRWVQQGMPRGDLAALPPQPKRVAGWHLGSRPDVELAMRNRPFVVPADGIVEYQYFVVDPKWSEDRWIRAAQVMPGDASVVHHSIVFVRPPDGSYIDGIGWMGAYVPGQRTAPLPPGHARRIPAGSKLIFQMHYTPNGRKTEDLTKVGVWFSAENDVTHEVTTRVALNQDFEIPPGAKDFEVELQLSGFTRESRLLSATPHMHLRGKSFQLNARRGEQSETLLHVPRYDFNWQHWYQFQSPLDLEPIDALEMRVRFDNSQANPVNPAPHEYVTWGDQTGEEMAVAFFDVAHPRGRPRVAVRRKTPDSIDAASRARQINKRVEEFLARMDRDGDGEVSRDEAPITFQRFGWWRFDRNRDKRIDRNELEQVAAERQ